MKLILSQSEIDEALKSHVLSTIALHGHTDITISYTAGRGPSGLTAEIDINYLDVSGLTQVSDAPSNVSSPTKVPEEGKTNTPIMAEETEECVTPAAPPAKGESLFSQD